MLKRLLLLSFFVFAFFVGFAQTPTTQGTEFWASFMRNGYNSTNGSFNNFTLIASAKHACTVTVTNPNTGWSDHFFVPNNGVSTFAVSQAQGYNDQKGGKANKGFYITSTDTISLYIANEAENSYDAANVLPAPALGSHYMLQSYKAIGDQSNHQGDSRASFLVLATEDNTEVQITPSCLTYDNHSAGRPYTVSLNRGECYHVLNMNAGYNWNADGDFSGTIVTSAEDKPIAVFNGNSITSVPGGLSTGYDHVFEQAMPTNYWGKSFVVTSTLFPSYMNLSPDQIKVTALNDNTTVTRNGAPLFTLNAGESNSFEMNLLSEPCVYLEADNPIAVFLYQHSHGNSNPAYGDPSMVWISPVEQTVYEVTFSTFQVQEVEVHYANIVCYSENVADMTLDGQNISSLFLQVPGFPEFSYARLQLNHAAHTLRCPRGFVAHVYGIGQAEGYAYTVGSSAKILTKQLYVNDILSTELPDGYYTCQSEAVRFRVETNYEPDLIVWDFGDGSPTAQGAEVSHAFTIDGVFDVEVVVDHVVNGTQQSDTLSTTIHVNPQIEVRIIDSTCNPIYVYDEIVFPVPFFGDSIVTSDDGCDRIYHMEIMEGSSQSFVEYDTACLEFSWFDTLRYASGTYVVVLGLPGGCDSLFILHLTIGKPPENPVRHKTSCSSYYWDNRLVCDTTGIYHLQFTTDDYCDYDSVLYFTRLYEPPFEKILGPSNVAVTTSFWPGKYVYCLDDSTGMNLGNIHWELLDDPGWEIEANGASCVIRTGVTGSAVLHVWTTGNGSCDKHVYKEINCGGFDVGENGVENFEIYPNPASDELTIKGEVMERVVLYDLMGRRIKEFAAHYESMVTLPVDDLKPGLYLVGIQTQKSNVTRLVSVRR